jgi:hypothetical protein
MDLMKMDMYPNLEEVKKEIQVKKTLIRMMVKNQVSVKKHIIEQTVKTPVPVFLLRFSVTYFLKVRDPKLHNY